MSFKKGRYRRGDVQTNLTIAELLGKFWEESPSYENPKTPKSPKKESKTDNEEEIDQNPFSISVSHEIVLLNRGKFSCRGCRRLPNCKVIERLGREPDWCDEYGKKVGL